MQAHDPMHANSLLVNTNMRTTPFITTDVAPPATTCDGDSPTLRPLGPATAGATPRDAPMTASNYSALCKGPRGRGCANRRRGRAATIALQPFHQLRVYTLFGLSAAHLETNVLLVSNASHYWPAALLDVVVLPADLCSPTIIAEIPTDTAISLRPQEESQSSTGGTLPDSISP